MVTGRKSLDQTQGQAISPDSAVIPDGHIYIPKRVGEGMYGLSSAKVIIFA